jgi:PGF-CTERM protein
MRHRRRHRGRGRLCVAVGLTLLLVCGTFVGAAAAIGATTHSEPTERGSDTVRSDVARAVGGTLNVTATPGTVAAGVGDTVAISGMASVETVRLYLIGPRGTFLDARGESEAMETDAVSDGAFSEMYEAFGRRGTYTLLVVSPRGDGVFAASETLDRDALPSELRRDQAVDLVRSAYGGDEVVELTLRGATSSLSVDPFDGDAVPRVTDLEVSGRSNRGDGTEVYVDLLDGDQRVVTGAVATVDASTGTWSTTLDTADLAPGSYTLFVDDGETDASRVVIVEPAAGETETPAETPLPDDTGDTADATGAAAANETVDEVTNRTLQNATDGLEQANEVVGNTGGNGTTGNATGEATTGGTGTASANATTNGTSTETTSEGVPGFGSGVTVAAVVVTALAARRWLQT